MSLRTAFDSPDTKRRYVRQLFSTIADRYDLITALLSYGQDARWKRTLVAMAKVRAGERALDLACGTGDLAFALAAHGARTVGLDITHRMLQLANAKQVAAAGAARPVTFLGGDMTNLPFEPAAFGLVTTGYGLRNVPDLTAAIAEIARVLKPGGRLLSLDFNRPEPAAIRAAYLWYSPRSAPRSAGCCIRIPTPIVTSPHRSDATPARMPSPSGCGRRASATCALCRCSSANEFAPRRALALTSSFPKPMNGVDSPPGRGIGVQFQI